MARTWQRQYISIALAVAICDVVVCVHLCRWHLYSYSCFTLTLWTLSVILKIVTCMQYLDLRQSGKIKETSPGSQTDRRRERVQRLEAGRQDIKDSRWVRTGTGRNNG